MSREGSRRSARPQHDSQSERPAKSGPLSSGIHILCGPLRLGRQLSAKLFSVGTSGVEQADGGHVGKSRSRTAVAVAPTPVEPGEHADGGRVDLGELHKFSADQDFVASNRDQLLADYGPHWIAVLDGEVVAIADEQRELPGQLDAANARHIQRLVTAKLGIWPALDPK